MIFIRESMKNGLLHRILSLCNSPFPLLQQLVQFAINRLCAPADNDLTRVFSWTDDARCSCRLHGSFIYPIVVLYFEAQTCSTVAGAYHILFSTDGVQNTLCKRCISACFGSFLFFRSCIIFSGSRSVKVRRNMTYPLFWTHRVRCS